jgi:hypothetical protein
VAAQAPAKCDGVIGDEREMAQTPHVGERTRRRQMMALAWLDNYERVHSRQKVLDAQRSLSYADPNSYNFVGSLSCVISSPGILLLRVSSDLVHDRSKGSGLTHCQMRPVLPAEHNHNVSI